MSGLGGCAVGREPERFVNVMNLHSRCIVHFIGFMDETTVSDKSICVAISPFNPLRNLFLLHP